MQQAQKDSTLTIENRRLISLTGVGSVEAFSDSGITLTVNGARVQISGSQLKVLAFSQGTGAFSASGEVSSVKFGVQKGKFLQKFLR